MKDTKIIKSLNGMNDLLETFTTESESKKLLQVETNIVYFDKVVDAIIGYNEDETPIIKYTYEEIDKTQEDYDKEKELAELRAKFGGNK